MSVPATKERIIALLETVPEIAKVARGSVRQINEFPYFLVFSGQAQHSKDGNDMKRITRNYQIWGLIKGVERDAETEAEQAVEPFFAIIENLFDERPGLGLNNTNPIVADSRLIGDSGSMVYLIAKAYYAACVWTLEVVENKQVTPGA